MVPNTKQSRLDLICSSWAQLRRDIHTAFVKKDEVFGPHSSEAETKSAGFWVSLQGGHVIVMTDMLPELPWCAGPPPSTGHALSHLILTPTLWGGLMASL